MENILIITTINDLSIPLFLCAKSNIKREFLFFHETIEDFKKTLEKDYTYIYIRDPFNEKIKIANNIDEKVGITLTNKRESIMIDNINNIEDIYCEDKRIQYSHYKDFMPSTELLTTNSSLLEEKYIIKKRISSRGRNIYFDIQDTENIKNKNEYIIQKQITGVKEYRIYIIKDEIMPIAGVKSIKTKTRAVKVIGTEAIPPQAIKKVEEIIKNQQYDFVGIDLMETEDGHYKLIEINRSCLFTAYFQNTKINLAEVFLDKISIKN